MKRWAGWLVAVVALVAVGMLAVLLTIRTKELQRQVATNISLRKQAQPRATKASQIDMRKGNYFDNLRRRNYQQQSTQQQTSLADFENTRWLALNLGTKQSDTTLKYSLFFYQKGLAVYDPVNQTAVAAFSIIKITHQRQRNTFRLLLQKANSLADPVTVDLFDDGYHILQLLDPKNALGVGATTLYYENVLTPND